MKAFINLLLLTLSFLTLPFLTSAHPTKTVTKTHYIKTKIVTVTETAACPTVPNTTSTPTTTYTACAPTLESVVANYDDIPFNSNSSNPAYPPTPYKGLVYSNWQLNRYTGFIRPATGNTTIISHDARIPRTIKRSSINQTFRLTQLAYACSSGYPQDECKITIVGIGAKELGRKEVRQEMTYPKLNSDEGFYMALWAAFDANWGGLEEVRFEGGTINGTAEHTAIMLDSLAYELTTCVLVE